MSSDLVPSSGCLLHFLPATVYTLPVYAYPAVQSHPVPATVHCTTIVLQCDRLLYPLPADSTLYLCPLIRLCTPPSASNCTLYLCPLSVCLLPPLQATVHCTCVLQCDCLLYPLPDDTILYLCPLFLLCTVLSASLSTVPLHQVLCKYKKIFFIGMKNVVIVFKRDASSLGPLDLGTLVGDY